MKLRAILPIIANGFREEAKRSLHSVAREGTDISVCVVERGPLSIECQYDVAVALPDILIHVARALKEEMDGVIIDCMADPGLEASRELANIPIIGMGEASFHLASLLAHRFSVVSILDRDIPDLDRMLRKYGVHSQVASVRVINIPVLDLRRNEDDVARATTAAALLAVREDGAGAIALGCSGLSRVVPRMVESLKAEV